MKIFGRNIVTRADALAAAAEERFKLYEMPHLDAAENYFFSRETEFISRELIKVEYAQGRTRKLLPIDSQMDPSDDSYTWRLWDQAGKAARVADNGADVPQVGVFGTENNQRVDVYALGYSFTEDEIRKAAKLGRPLERDRAQAVRDGIERQLNDIAADGDTAAGLTGFLGLASVNTMTPSTKGVGGTSWIDAGGLLVATADEVIKDVNLLIRKVFVDSKEIENVSRVVFPTAQFALLAQTPRTSGTDTTILQFLKNNNPDVEFMSWERLKGDFAGQKDRMIGYKPDSSKLKLLLPIEFEQQAPQLENYKYKVNCRMKCGGVIAHKPKSIIFGDGIGV